MEEIEVGEYVRTKRGISKVLEVKTVQPKMYGKHDVVYLIDKCPRMYISNTEFIKHSKNIIDLIEVGDYVNGFEVIETDTGYEVDSQIVVSTPTYKEVYLLGDDIETILTKEQYMQNCYKCQDIENGTTLEKGVG